MTHGLFGLEGQHVAVAVIYPEVIRELVAVVEGGGKLIYSTPSSPTTPTPILTILTHGVFGLEGQYVAEAVIYPGVIRELVEVVEGGGN